MLKIKDLKIRKNVSLAPLTTFKIGGAAGFFVTAKNKEELRSAWYFGQEKNLPLLALGGGSNLLISDEGFAGLVIQIDLSDCRFNQETVSAGAGVLMSDLARETIKRGLGGLEWAGGLPGAVGGAVRGNAGAFRQEIGTLIEAVEVLRQGEFLKLRPEECGFAYRASLFKTQYKDDIITEAALRLRKEEAGEVRKKFEEFLAHRERAQPPEPSAGCIFKNFLIADDGPLTHNVKQLKNLPEEFLKRKKIPAAWLVEQAGLKGARVGRAEISARHANFIVNLGGAKAVDVLSLIQLVKEKVYNEFRIELEEEVRIVK